MKNEPESSMLSKPLWENNLNAVETNEFPQRFFFFAALRHTSTRYLRYSISKGIRLNNMDLIPK